MDDCGELSDRGVSLSDGGYVRGLLETPVLVEG